MSASLVCHKTAGNNKLPFPRPVLVTIKATMVAYRRALGGSTCRQESGCGEAYNKLEVISCVLL